MGPAAPRPLVFACEGERLVGVLHPADGNVGVVIVVGGPQYRAGSHRHFVQVASAVAAAGRPVLRFDVRGMGDSSGQQCSFEQITPDIAAAIDALCTQQPQVRSVVLWALCDGASAALIYLHERADPRVAGLCLMNPWVRSEASQARTHVRHYYRRRLMSGDFWRKLLNGRVASAAVSEWWTQFKTARRDTPVTVPGFQARMLWGWQAFRGATLLILSGRDYTAAEFIEYTRDQPAWQAVLTRPSLQHMDMPHADHTFSRADDGLAVIRATVQWLAGLPDASAHGSAAARPDPVPTAQVARNAT
jgi:uncharacterized protein